MPSNYNPDFTVPSAAYGQDPVAIVSSTFATPIEVEVTSHGYSDGDSLTIAGHTVNTNANGDWTITVTGTDTFELNGSVGNGVGGADGYVINYSVLPETTLISDTTDDLSASFINPAPEGISNFLPFFYRGIGWCRCLGEYFVQHDDAGGPLAQTVWSNTALVGSNAWVWATNNPILAPSFLQPPVTLAGDLLDVTINVNYVQTAGANAIPMAVGVLNTTAGIYKVPGSAFILPIGFLGPVTLHGFYDAQSVNLTVGLYNIGVTLFDLPAGGTVALIGDYSISVRHLRRN